LICSSVMLIRSDKSMEAGVSGKEYREVTNQRTCTISPKAHYRKARVRRVRIRPMTLQENRLTLRQLQEHETLLLEFLFLGEVFLVRERLDEAR
jgi:hypothetical protein